MALVLVAMFKCMVLRMSLVDEMYEEMLREAGSNGGRDGCVGLRCVHANVMIKYRARTFGRSGVFKLYATPRHLVVGVAIISMPTRMLFGGRLTAATWHYFHVAELEPAKFESFDACI
jgi:hypothetical protein